MSKMIERSMMVFVFLVAFFLGNGFVSAQESQEVTDRRAQLNAELAQIESDIQAQRGVLSEKQKEKASLERDVAILNASIKKAQLGIKARNIAVQNLGDDIGEKKVLISALSDKTEREKASLSQLLRKTDELEDASLIEVLLTDQNVSDFFMDVDEFDSIKQALGRSFQEIRSVKNTTEVERKALEEKKIEEVELKTLQEIEKRKLVDNQQEKQQVLKVTKGKEAEYQKIIKEKEKTAGQIRAELFGLRGSTAISFEKAYELALAAEKKTGVRPAFLLGIIAEESNLGENVGTGNWKTDMHPDRDVPVFEDLTRRLGLNPDTVPVSKKPWYGWGGAMGPAQFIPSTWVLYESKIADLTGHTPPNPWDPGDAFMASALLLKENGAAKGGYANERLAALRYLAGWKNAQKPAYAFYGDDVMGLAGQYQKSIDVIKGN
jgi:hypothetical protein